MEQVVQMNTNQIYEESIKRARDLKRNELRWKLMQISQVQNRAKLNDIQTAVNYHKRKLSKAQELASRLRTKYLRVVKSAKLTEEQYKKAEAQLSLQEKYVADEKMQLTRLALDCINTGKQLYGDSYKLPENVCSKNSHNPSFKPPTRIGCQILGANKNISSGDIISDKLTPFLANARLNANNKLPIDQAGLPPVKKRKVTSTNRLSSLYDINDSIFRNFASYRLTSRYSETGSSVTDLIYSHNIAPLDYICLPDLLGECSDKSCLYQHRSNYQMTDLEKLADILSYKPSMAGFKEDPNLSSEENDKLCRIKLKQRAAMLISRNPNKSVEIIAKNLVKKIRSNESDMELLLKRRESPKVIHWKYPPPIKCPCEVVIEGRGNGDKNDTGPTLAVSIKIEPKDPDECMPVSQD